MNKLPTSWKYFNTPNTAWDALIKACENAKKSIDIEQYVFVNDETGSLFLETLKKKAAEGVKVRLLCDTAGSFSFYTSFYKPSLKKNNIEISFFNTFVPVIFRSHYSWWFFRDHRKLAIIDKEVGFTGSICIWEYSRDWRDSFIEIRGEVVAEMQSSFDSMWERAHRRPTPDYSRSIGVGADGFNFVTNVPRINRRELYYRIVDAMRHAEKYIYITVPYFVPDRRMIRVIRLARRRGVDVRIILPEKCDYQVVDIAARGFFDELLKVGVKIFIYKPRFIHNKSIIIDDSWVTIGSMNLDNVSLTYNFEANLVSTDKKFITENKNQFLEDMKETSEVTYKEWKNRALKDKVLEWLVKFIRKML